MAKTKEVVTESEVDFGNENVELADVDMLAPSPTELAEMKALWQKQQAEAAAQAAAEAARNAVHANVPKVNLVNCLRHQRLYVRYIPKQSGLFSSNKHVLAGGISETAVKTFCCPILQSGNFKRVLTESEEAFLEDYMGLKPGTLSPYNNTFSNTPSFWSTANKNNANIVKIGKAGLWLDLANPNDYIKYKILLGDAEHICPSLQQLKDAPKATYMFVIVDSSEETKLLKNNMSLKAECWKIYGKHEDNEALLRLIVESVTGTPVEKFATLEVVQTRIGDIIEQNAKMFLSVVKDPYIETKVLIKKCVDKGLISKRNNLYYLKSDNSPLCDTGEESTLTNAAKYLNLPRMNTLLMSLEQKSEL